MAYKNNRIWAIIPARGGSKGIPRKNIAKIAGKPLIAYSIEQALESNYVEDIFVSSEDDEIKGISLQYGASLLDRPLNLSTDSTSTMEVLKYSIGLMDEIIGSRVENIILLQATTPLRKIDDIDNSIKLFFDEKADSVISVVESPHNFHPFWAKALVDGCLRPLIKTENLITRRQDLPKTYHHNGQIYITTRENLFQNEDWLQAKCLPFICRDNNCINIDTLDEFKVAEKKLKSFARKKEII